MFLSFLLPYIDRGAGPLFHWVMLAQMARMEPEEVSFIADKRYFNPRFVPFGKELSVAGFVFTVPTRERFLRYQMEEIEDSTFAALERHTSNMVDAFKVLLTERFAPLELRLRRSLASAATNNELEGVLSWCNCPSLEYVCAEMEIPVIHNEVGPFRRDAYAGTAYFDFRGVNGRTSTASLWNRRKLESAIPRPLPGPDLACLLTRAGAFRAEPFPENRFQVGVPLQVEDDSNVVAFSKGFDNLRLISAARKSAEASQVLIRRHPSSQFWPSDHLGVIDDSPNALHFISAVDRVMTINSSVAFEALLWGRETVVLGDSPAACLARLVRIRDSTAYRRLMEALMIGYLIPDQFLFSVDYYRWRLRKPRLIEILTRHREAYSQEVGKSHRLQQSCRAYLAGICETGAGRKRRRPVHVDPSWTSTALSSGQQLVEIRALLAEAQASAVEKSDRIAELERDLNASRDESIRLQALARHREESLEQATAWFESELAKEREARAEEVASLKKSREWLEAERQKWEQAAKQGQKSLSEAKSWLEGELARERIARAGEVAGLNKAKEWAEAERVKWEEAAKRGEQIITETRAWAARIGEAHLMATAKCQELEDLAEGYRRQTAQMKSEFEQLAAEISVLQALVSSQRDGQVSAMKRVGEADKSLDELEGRLAALAESLGKLANGYRVLTESRWVRIGVTIGLLTLPKG